MIRFSSLVFFLFVICSHVSGVEVTTYNSSINLAEAMKQTLCPTTPSGITNFTANYTTIAGESMAGTYKKLPLIDGVQLEDGVVLTSGKAIDCVGPNDHGSKTTSFGYPADNDLQSLVGTMVFDPSVMVLNFESDQTITGITFDFIFGSEEWKEYVGSQFNDIFVCLLDGRNICLDSDTNLIGINSPEFKVDNLDDHLDMQYDGFTVPLRTSTTLSPGQHTLKFAVADVSDALLDAGVFLSNFSFTFSGKEGTYPIDSLHDSIPRLIAHPSPTEERRPTLYWHPLQMPQAVYTIQIDTTGTFLSPIVSLPVADTVYTPAVDLPIDTIYWRVKESGGRWSPHSVFEIIPDMNLVPKIIPYVPKVTQNVTPTLSWHSVSGAALYILSIDDDYNFSSPITTTPLSDTTYTPVIALPYGPIYWHVKSDLVDYWSEPDKIWIVPDTIPFIIRYNGNTTSNARPEFKWHPVTGATSYKILVSDTNLFLNPIILPVADTVCVLPAALAAGVWYWQVSSSRNLALFCPYDSLVIDPSEVVPSVSESKKGVQIIQGVNGCRIIFHSALGNGIWVRIFSLQGKVIAELSIRTNSFMWDYTDKNGLSVPAGMYIMHIINGKEELFRKVQVIR